MEVHEHGFLLLAVRISRILQGILCLSMSALSPLLSGSDTGLNLGEEPNIAFGEDGTATYAAYFSLPKETHKGRFSVSSVIPETVMNIIDQIEKQ